VNARAILRPVPATLQPYAARDKQLRRENLLRGGSRRGKPVSKAPAKKGGRVGGPRGGAASAALPADERSASAKKATKTHAAKKGHSRK
jgi:hypothetical protein